MYEKTNARVPDWLGRELKEPPAMNLSRITNAVSKLLLAGVVILALGMVSAGVGSALVPDWESTLARKDIVLRQFSDIVLEQCIGLAYPEQQPLSPILSLTVDLCRQRWRVQNPS